MTTSLQALLAGLLVFGILPAQVDDLEKINRAAEAFAERSEVRALVADNRPQLAEAYPLIVRDYFSNAGREEPLPEPRPRQVNDCARHYENFWLKERFVWPTAADGSPDWAAIYVQAIDHYLGFCLQRSWFWD